MILPNDFTKLNSEDADVKRVRNSSCRRDPTPVSKPSAAPNAGTVSLDIRIDYLTVDGLQLDSYAHSPQSRVVLAVPGSLVQFVHGATTSRQIGTHRASYINAVLIQSRGATMVPPRTRCAMVLVRSPCAAASLDISRGSAITANGVTRACVDPRTLIKVRRTRWGTSRMRTLPPPDRGPSSQTRRKASSIILTPPSLEHFAAHMSWPMRGIFIGGIGYSSLNPLIVQKKNYRQPSDATASFRKLVDQEATMTKTLSFFLLESTPLSLLSDEPLLSSSSEFAQVSLNIIRIAVPEKDYPPWRQLDFETLNKTIHRRKLCFYPAI